MSMQSKQRKLPLRSGAALAEIWERLPESVRKEAIALYARLVARSAQMPPPSSNRRSTREDASR